MKYMTITGLRHLRMPMVGLGTWRAPADEVESTVLTALDIGYRHIGDIISISISINTNNVGTIDTAFNYNNEEAIGAAIKQWLDSGKGRREDLFITTKLPHIGNRASDVGKFLKMSLDRLQLDYVDLYLVHMPFAFCCNENSLTPAQNHDGTFRLDTNNDNIATWKAMEEQVRNGYTKAIGLSNFNADQLLNIYLHSSIKPTVLQVEMHAYLQQAQLMKHCQLMNIGLTAYAPLGSPGAQYHFAKKYNFEFPNYPDILGHPIVNKIALKHNRTSGQVLLRHLLHKNVAVIPKSSNVDRLKDNFNVYNFRLDRQDMKDLNSLDKDEAGRIFNFKFFSGVEKHPQYPFKKQLEKKKEILD